MWVSRRPARTCWIGGYGCWMTALHFSASSVTGIDKDPDLIRQAQSHISFLYSRLKPSSSPPDDADLDTDTKTYFPISSVLDHGHRRRPEPPSPPSLQPEDTSSALGFPFNVSFLTEDWSQPRNPQGDPPTYDVLLAFSVLKWIHIRAHDAGVTSFFQRCHAALVPTGKLVLEIQPWTSYVKAVKKMGRAGAAAGTGDVLEGLRLRPDDFGDVLVEIGFLREGTLEGEGLPRRIEVWKRV
ncbi:MAG: hypothetical protein M1813_003356 [Trichoglossum hirsutum]|nr:MAG: hypothetical protein M1813_003356 [Trichoglossum hirsutum]